MFVALNMQGAGHCFRSRSLSRGKILSWGEVCGHIAKSCYAIRVPQAGDREAAHASHWFAGGFRDERLGAPDQVSKVSYRKAACVRTLVRKSVQRNSIAPAFMARKVIGISP